MAVRAAKCLFCLFLKYSERGGEKNIGHHFLIDREVVFDWCSV